MLRLITLVASFALLTAGCNSNDVPAGTLAAMQQADEYELLSLNPQNRTEPPSDHFHGWQVLGRTAIKDEATRKQLNDALRAGARENSNSIASCFEPRHGIHVVRDGKVYDVVICFKCLHARVYEDGQRGANFLVSASPQLTFDDVLRAAGITLASTMK